VQVIPHVTNEIKTACGKSPRRSGRCPGGDRGTVGDIESLPFLEAPADAPRARSRERDLSPRHAGSLDCCAREMKSKPPAQRQECAPSVSSRICCCAAPRSRFLRHAREDRPVLRRGVEAVIRRAMSARLRGPAGFRRPACGRDCASPAEADAGPRDLERWTAWSSA